MNKMQFVLNGSGVRQLLQSEKMQKILSEKATRSLGRLGDGYKSDIYVGKSRANAMVYAHTYQAKSDNLKNNSILKAIQG